MLITNKNDNSTVNTIIIFTTRLKLKLNNILGMLKPFFLTKPVVVL